MANLSRSYLWRRGIARRRCCREQNIRCDESVRPRSRSGIRKPLDNEETPACMGSDCLAIRFRFCLLKETLKNSAPIRWWRFQVRVVPGYREGRIEAFQTQKRSKRNRSNKLPHGLARSFPCISFSWEFHLLNELVEFPYLAKAFPRFLSFASHRQERPSFVALIREFHCRLSNELNDTQGVGPTSERQGHGRPRDGPRSCPWQ